MSCNLCEQRAMYGLEGECSQCVAQKRIANLEAEVERLRADGERLDWMEAQMHKANCWLPAFDRHSSMWFIADEDAYQTFRAAIDAARKEKG